MIEDVIYRQPVDSDDLRAALDIAAAGFSDAWSYNSFETALKLAEYTFIVAELNSVIIGYAVAYKVLNEAEIVSIAVDEKKRGCGFGKALLENLIDKLIKEKMTYFVLEVRQSNSVAIKLYESSGFKIIGTRKNFYSCPNEDAYIMIKEQR